MNTVATRPQQSTEIIRARNFDDLQRTMLGYLAKSKERIGSIIDARSVIAAVQCFRNNPKLLECEPASLFTAIVQAGAYGWMCDGITGHAAVIPFRVGKKNPDGTWQPSKATLVPGYKGLMDLVRRTGQCEPTMESVHQGDEYMYRGRFKEPIHNRGPSPNRRQLPITDVYVLGVFSSGMIKCFSWTREECLAHRDAHVANWKNAVKYSRSDEELKQNLWHEDNPAFVVMCMKSVMRHAINRGEFPISVRDMRLLAQEDEPIEGTIVPGAGITQEDAERLALGTSEPGYAGTLHSEDQDAYTVDAQPGDDIAADAEKHIADQTPAGAPDLQADWEKKVRECKAGDIDQTVTDALENDGVDVTEAAKLRKDAIAFKAGEKTRHKKSA